jgi:predicted transcriptional regulator
LQALSHAIVEGIGSRRSGQRDQEDKRRDVRAHSMLEVIGTVFCESNSFRERKAAGLTQRELADRLHKPQSFVAKYEGGERRIDVVEFLTVCQPMGVDHPAKLLKALKNVIATGNQSV